MTIKQIKLDEAIEFLMNGSEEDSRNIYVLEPYMKSGKSMLSCKTLRAYLLKDVRNFTERDDVAIIKRES